MPRRKSQSGPQPIPSPVSKLATALLSSELVPALSELGISPAALLSPTSDSAALVSLLSQQLEKANFNELSSNITQTLIEKHQFVRVETSLTTSSSRQGFAVYKKSQGDLTYSLCSLGELKGEILATANRWLDNATQDKLLDTFLTYVPLIKDRERRFMAIAPQLYWDSTKQALVPSVPKGHRCFIRLFDSPERVGGGIVSYPASSFDETFSHLVEDEYAATLSYLRSLDKPSFDAIIEDMPRDFHFIEEWGNDDPGLYWDILTLIATVFMRNKPLGAYFLTGIGRNGKSSCVNLLHSIFGTHNTSRVRLSQIGDPHFANTLTTSVLNAPDDENDDITKYQGVFKELAGHQLYSATQLYSGTPLIINGGDITFVFPMNTLPKWKGTSAAACSKRTNPIPFNHDFSASDNATNNFEQLTYTKDTLGRIAAQAMALATYYSEHPEAFGYSPASISQKDVIAEDNNNVTKYKKEFEQIFCGFQNKRLLYDDYRIWCNEKGYRFALQSSVELAFQEYMDARYKSNKVYPGVNGNLSRKCRKKATSNLRARPLMEDLYIDEYKMTVAQLHDNGVSAVFKLHEDYYGED